MDHSHNQIHMQQSRGWRDKAIAVSYNKVRVQGHHKSDTAWGLGLKEWWQLSTRVSERTQF